MLTQEQNELLVRTDAGTPCGELMRRYWQPVGLSEEIPPRSAPKPVRVFGEDLVLFRDDQGYAGLIGLICPHRGCDLSYGRIEHGGLRCIYHGWLFARDGRCLEQPGEGAASTFKDRVQHIAYPCHEANGLIFAYLGADEPPPIPAFPFLTAPAERVWCTKIWHDCNYLQGNEGNVDPQHLSFLHRMFLPNEIIGDARIMYTMDVAPELVVEETGFGLRAYAVRDAGDEKHYVRISNFIMPNGSAFDGIPLIDPLQEKPRTNLGYQAHWHVPVDDTHHFKYVVVHRYDNPVDRAYLDRAIKDGLDENYRGRRVAANRYQQDRKEMDTLAYAGLGLNFQDHDRFAIESLGPILDRSKERLGTTDTPVIVLRKQMLQAIDDVRAGREPRMSLRDGSNPLHDLIVHSAQIPKKSEIRGFWRALVACLALLAMFGGPAGAQVPAPAGDPYELQAILSTTGPGAFLGASAAKTMKIIEDLTNRTGGIHGRPLHIVVSDDQSIPQVAVELTNGLIAKKAPVILGPSLTATCAANGPLLVQAGPVMYCVSPYIDPAAGSYVFANGPTATDNAVVVLRYYRERGFRRIAMLNATDASGQVLDKAFEAAFSLPENRSLTLVAHQRFAPNDVSVAAQLAQIKASNPQVIVAWTVGTPFNTVIRGAHDAGLDVPICTNGANMNAAQIADLAGSLPTELDFAGYPSWVTGAKLPPPVMKAQDVFAQAFKGAGIRPDGGYASVWDLTTMVVDALRHLPPNPTARQVRDYLTKLRGWAGANAIYDFTAIAQRGVGENGYIIATYDTRSKNFLPVSLPGGAPAVAQ